MEKALLVGADLGEEDFEQSMDELSDLALACDIETAGLITQKMETVNKAFYIGTGKVDEVKEYAQDIGADLIIFDNALSPSQLRNVQKETGKPILDRTSLILDIFSKRARTREARLQVETARLQYLLPRLVGMHDALSRQGGGSGLSNKGAGEKKLELDRRKIEHRLAELGRELEDIAKERDTQRKQRQSSGIPQVALVGYTNAGKSTIMNRMIEVSLGDEDKHVLEKDMLFATLETTVRKIEPGDNQNFLLSDTVGFIHKLPTGLVKAFRSTLEEVRNADLLLHVVDYSDENYKKQIEVTESTLRDLDAGDIPVIYVFNKADKRMETLPKLKGEDKIYMSAADARGIRELTGMITGKLYHDYVRAEFLFPYDRGQAVSYFMENALVEEQEYLENGSRMLARCHQGDLKKYAEYVVHSDAKGV